MNNPPTTEPVDHETEHYAHDVSKHVRGYLIVGATLLIFTGLTVALSYVNLGSQKANVAVAMLVATFKAGVFAFIFLELSAEKKIIFRVRVFTWGFFFALFCLTFLA